MMLLRTNVQSAVHINVFAASLLFLCPTWADASHAGEKPPAKREAHPKGRCQRVHDIFIIGNTITRDAVILRQIPFKPGDKFTMADLRLAHRNLVRLKVFMVDPAPEIRILDIEDEEVFKDIVVTVSERPRNAYFWAMQESLEFLGFWAQWGLQVAILWSVEGTFPNDLIRFVLSGNRYDCPFAIDYFLNSLEPVP